MPRASGVRTAHPRGSPSFPQQASAAGACGGAGARSQAGSRARSARALLSLPDSALRWPRACRPLSQGARPPGGVCPRLAAFVLRPGEWILKIAWEEARSIFSRSGSGPSQFPGQQIWAKAVEKGGGVPLSRVPTRPGRPHPQIAGSSSLLLCTQPALERPGW